MKYYNHIAVCVDFSAASRIALEQSLHFRQSKHKKISVIYIAAPEEVGDFEGINQTESNIAKENLRDNLMKFSSLYGVTPDFAEYMVIIGDPSDAVAGYIKKIPTDLLVLGSRGHDPMARHAGHFATKCVRYSPIPVFLSKGPVKDRIEKVVACVDFSSASQEVIQTGARIAEEEKAVFHVIHATTPPWQKPSHIIYALERMEKKDFRKDHRDLLRSRLETAVVNVIGETTLKPVIDIREHISPDQAITDYLHENQADLAVVGRLGHLKQLVSQCFIGTTAERLIRLSPCSILTVPCNPEDENL